jgi:hypothetical protein
MFEAGVKPSTYQEQGKSYDFPDMSNKKCTQCKKGELRKHGFYSRMLVTIGFEGSILIRRYYCRACKKTVSTLPSFCHPKRTYSTLIIYGLLSEFYVMMKSVSVAVVDYLKKAAVDCSRQLLLHYRKRIEGNLGSLIMAVTEAFSLRSPPVTEKTSIRKRVGQLLSNINSPEDASLKIFEHSRTSYLTPYRI